MSIKRVGVILILLLAIGAVWVQMFLTFRELGTLRKDQASASAQLKKLVAENQTLERDIQFYAIPENLTKEARERFNYKKPGEHMIIVVPTP